VRAEVVRVVCIMCRHCLRLGWGGGVWDHLLELGVGGRGS